MPRTDGNPSMVLSALPSKVFAAVYAALRRPEDQAALRGICSVAVDGFDAAVHNLHAPLAVALTNESIFSDDPTGDELRDADLSQSEHRLRLSPSFRRLRFFPGGLYGKRSAKGAVIGLASLAAALETGTSGKTFAVDVEDVLVECPHDPTEERGVRDAMANFCESATSTTRHTLKRLLIRSHKLTISTWDQDAISSSDDDGDDAGAGAAAAGGGDTRNAGGAGAQPPGASRRVTRDPPGPRERIRPALSLCVGEEGVQRIAVRSIPWISALEFPATSKRCSPNVARSLEMSHLKLIMFREQWTECAQEPASILLSHTEIDRLGRFASNGNIGPVTLVSSSINSVHGDAFINSTVSGTLDLSESKISTVCASFGSHINVKSIVLPQSLRAAGANFLELATGLKTLDMRRTNLMIITSNMLQSARSLEEITFPNAIFIDSNVLAQAASLRKIVLTESKNIEAIGNRFACSASSLEEVEGLETLENLGLIGADAFAQTDVAAVTLPKGLIRIAYGFLSQCSLLTSVDLSACDKLVRADDGWFEACVSLGTILLPTSLKEIGDRFAVMTPCLAELDLSKTHVEKIGSDFLQSSGVATLKLPECLRSIGDGFVAETGALNFDRETDLKHTKVGQPADDDEGSSSSGSDDN